MLLVSPTITTLEVHGDSIAYGYNATSTAVYGFAARLAAKLGLTLVNRAVPATGVQNSTVSSFQNDAPFTSGPPSKLVILEAGHNDLVYAALQTPDKLYGELLSIVTNKWAASSVAAATTGGPNPTLQLIGAWNVGDTSLLDKASQSSLGGRLLWSSQTGSSITGQFIGDNLVIRGFNTPPPGQGSGIMNLAVDSYANVATFNGNQRSDGVSFQGLPTITHSALFTNGWGASTHNFTLANTNGQPFWMDAWDTLLPPQQCDPILVMDAPRPVAYSTLGPGTSTPNTFGAGDTVVETVVNQFKALGYPIRRVRTNDFLTSNNISSDGEHPSNAGHQQIADACMAQLCQ